MMGSVSVDPCLFRVQLTVGDKQHFTIRGMEDILHLPVQGWVQLVGSMAPQVIIDFLQAATGKYASCFEPQIISR